MSGAWKREEHILMQRCCSGSGRAHTQAPSPATAAATGAAATAPGQQCAAEGAGEEREAPRALAARLGLAHRLGQHPPAPVNTPLSPQVGADQFCLPGGCSWGIDSELRAQCPCNLGGAGAGAWWEPQLQAGASRLLSTGTGRVLCPVCMGGILQGPAGQAGQEAGPQLCAQEFKLTTGHQLTAATAFREDSCSSLSLGPTSRTTKSLG